MSISSRALVRAALLLAFVAAIPIHAAANEGGAAPEHPTFARDVLPILQRSCQVCHRPDMFTPMSLLTYEDVRPWARAITGRGGIGSPA